MPGCMASHRGDDFNPKNRAIEGVVVVGIIGRAYALSASPAARLSALPRPHCAAIAPISPEHGKPTRLRYSNNQIAHTRSPSGPTFPNV
jgi:hypothetical protein